MSDRIKYNFKNSIYEGKVFHNRLKPKKHSFKYSVFYLHFDIVNAKKNFKKIPILSFDRFNLLSFYQKDHGPFDCKNLEMWCKKVLKKSGIKKNIASIFLLTYPRVLGYVFNPLSIYTCIDNKNNIVAQIFEVHNTFKQRHFYIADNTFKKRNHNKRIKKDFHVSPFMSMEGSYQFKSFQKGTFMTIMVDYYSKNECLKTSFSGERKKLTNLNLLKNFFKKPIMTLIIIIGIHLEATILFLKGLNFYKCPPKLKNNTSNSTRG